MSSILYEKNYPVARQFPISPKTVHLKIIEISCQAALALYGAVNKMVIGMSRMFFAATRHRHAAASIAQSDQACHASRLLRQRTVGRRRRAGDAESASETRGQDCIRVVLRA